MRKTLRLLLSGLFVFVFAFSLVVALEQDVQADKSKVEYTCCRYMYKEGPIRQHVYGVWIDNTCVCDWRQVDQNPNECRLDCWDPM